MGTHTLGFSCIRISSPLLHELHLRPHGSSPQLWPSTQTSVPLPGLPQIPACSLRRNLHAKHSRSPHISNPHGSPHHSWGHLLHTGPSSPSGTRVTQRQVLSHMCTHPCVLALTTPLLQMRKVRSLRLVDCRGSQSWLRVQWSLYPDPSLPSRGLLTMSLWTSLCKPQAE